MRSTIALLLFASLAACGSSTDGAPRRDEVASEDALPPYDEDPCAHVQGGPRGLHPAASDLARAHALVRWFGTEGAAADERLADVLDEHEPSSPGAVAAYARAVEGACAADALPATALAPGSVTMSDGVAIVVPGVGNLPPVPPEAKAVAVDVRALGDGDEALAALERALAAIISGSVARLDVEERLCTGAPDEVYTLFGTTIDQYACEARVVGGGKIEGAGSSLPLAVLTSTRLTPLAAYAAVTLRARAGAFVIGESVPAQIAESTWVGIGDRGIAVRTRRLLLSARIAIPDVLDADVRAADPVAALAGLDWSAERPALGPGSRPSMKDFVRLSKWRARSDRSGDGRAALVTAHAAARTFFPYFDVIGDVIDTRLDETLAMVAGDASRDRVAVRRALSRFSAALHDGHAYIADRYQDRPAGHPPVALVPIGDELVVAVSSTPDAKPGDVVVTIDGRPAGEVHADAQRFVSGSPHVVRIASAEMLIPGAPTPVVLRSAGTTRAVTLQPGANAVSTFGMFDRAAGPLTDFGAEDVYYVSLNGSGEHALQLTDLPAIEAGMAGKRGVILDLRGYPGEATWELLGHIAPSDSFGPKMLDLLVGPSARSSELNPTQVLGSFSSSAQGFTGPIVLLTGAYTQSSAEHWTSFFRSKQRGKIVGGTTSGANGTITGVQLPGGFGLTFTGMIVQHPDGSPFHARGHTPDIAIGPTVEDLRAGKDTVLLRALAEIPQ